MRTRRKQLSSSDYNSSDTDFLAAEAQRSDRSDLDVEPDEGVVTEHTSLQYSRTQRISQSSVGGIFLEASQTVSTSRPAYASPEMVGGSSLAIASTSSKSAAHTSVGKNDEQSADCLACSICFAKFSTQEIGTTDTCNHSFCAACIKEWAMYVSTCPLDRQTFRFILIRHRLKGEIIKKIPVRSVRKELSFCGVCGECDFESRLLLCEGCSFACHVTCLDPPLDATDYRQWICPYCFSFNETMPL
jgi:hypothetical protein